MSSTLRGGFSPAGAVLDGMPDAAAYPTAGRLFPRAVTVGWLALIAAVTVSLGVGSAAIETRLTIGNGMIALGGLFAVGACARAAARPTPSRRGWTWMAVAMALGATGQVVFTVGAVRGRVAEASSLTDALGYLGYAVPSIVALFAFPRPSAPLISRFRSVLDAVVIAAGVVLISEATVLDVVRGSANLSTVSGAAGLAYPVADVVICAVVLTLGMRQPPQTRLIWSCLGLGLLCLAVTDSVYVRLRVQGVTGLTGSPLVAGWVLAPVLIGLATWVPESVRGTRHWNLDLVSRLIPYLPVLGAVVVVGVGSTGDDPFLLAGGIVLLVTVTVRQVMIVYENLRLTHDLEAKVAARTAELTTLGSIVTSSRDAIASVSTAGAISSWNPAAEQLFGLRAGEVLGQRPDFLSPAVSASLRRTLDAARLGELVGEYETEWERPDGATVPMAMTVSPVRADGVLAGISVAARDITEQRRAAAVLEQARQEALESSRMKSEFLATMSHEIRTPMNGVIGLTSLLLDTDLDARQRGYTEGVHSAGQSLLDVINDILDFSKLEAGKVVLEVEEFDLARLVHEVGNLLAPTASAKGLELLVSYPPQAPTTVCGDRTRLRQVLLNLAANAVKFTEAGEVQIMVEVQPLDECMVAVGVEVIDTGIGVAESDQPRLFESFSQADASTTRRYGGTGLGLAICRRLIEAMDGEIGVRSVPAHGSTFWFNLELPLGHNPSAEPYPIAPDLAAGLRVLVVDDSAANRTILAAQLTAWRMEVDLTSGANDALAALRAAARAETPYDLAVLDMLMPEIDGLELARMISADPRLRGLPMLMLTSAHRLPAAAFADAGIGRWLTKPVGAPQLYEQIVRLVGGTEPSPSLQPPPATPPCSAPVRSVGRARILVVEDNELNRLVAAGLAARHGFDTRMVSNGVEALEVMAQERFAAVLMDCHMPVMDGFAATEEIRRRESDASRTPIVALTAGALPADRERCLAAGMDDYLAKPLEADAFATVLRRWASPASVLDVEQLQSLDGLRSADGSSLLRTFVSSFARHSDGRSAAIRRAAASADHDALAAAVHELKGSAATIGAIRVAALCAELERGHASVGQGQLRILDDVEHELRQANRALHAFVSGQA